MSETTRKVGPAIPYEATQASAQYGLYISTEGYRGEDEEFVTVETISCLYGPPMGPWYEITVVNTVGQHWQLRVYLNDDRTERPIENIPFVARP